jgi:hypothetical protein
MLAEIRTDLDTFTEVESYALMASGYLMADRQLRDLDKAHRAAHPDPTNAGSWGGFDIEAPMHLDSRGKPVWPFAPLISLMGQPPDSSDLRRRDLAKQLKAGNIMFGRVWHLVNWLDWLAKGVGAVAVIAGAIALWECWNTPITQPFSVTVGKLTVSLVLFLGPFISPVFKYINRTKATQSFFTNVGIGFAGWAITNIHMWIFDPLLKRRGRLAKLVGRGGAEC